MDVTFAEWGFGDSQEFGILTNPYRRTDVGFNIEGASPKEPCSQTSEIQQNFEPSQSRLSSVHSSSVENEESGTPRGQVTSLLCRIVIVALMAPFVSWAIRLLPWWLLIQAAVIVSMMVLRALLRLFLGRHGANEVFAILTADAIRFCFRLCLAPFRLIPWLIRRA